MSFVAKVFKRVRNLKYFSLSFQRHRQKLTWTFTLTLTLFLFIVLSSLYKKTCRGEGGRKKANIISRYNSLFHLQRDRNVMKSLFEMPLEYERCCNDVAIWTMSAGVFVFGLVISVSLKDGMEVSLIGILSCALDWSLTKQNAKFKHQWCVVALIWRNYFWRSSISILSHTLPELLKSLLFTTKVQIQTLDH